MRDTDERLELMHRRVNELQRGRDRILLLLRGGSLIILAAALAVSLADCSGKVMFLNRDIGAALLGKSPGGYILMAIAALTAAVGIAAFLTKRVKPGEKTDEKESRPNDV